MQDAIPISTVYDDGLFRVGKNQYSRTYKFEDINYQVASEIDKETMFERYCALLNSLDSNATTKITINNRKLNQADFEKRIFIKEQDDNLNAYRREYNQMLLEKATAGNSIMQEKYITVTVTEKSADDARQYFNRFGASLAIQLNKLGSKCTELGAIERLRILPGRGGKRLYVRSERQPPERTQLQGLYLPRQHGDSERSYRAR